MSLSLKKMLDNYRISHEVGFAMDRPSPTSFKNASLAPWIDIATQIPNLLKSNTLRSRVDSLPILSADLLDPDSIEEYHLAFVLLTHLSQAYIWGTIGVDAPSSTLPASISVPLVQVSRDLDIQPAFCYAAGTIWLYTEDATTHKPRCICSFTGTSDEDHFNLTTHNVERIAGRALVVGLTAARCAGSKQSDELTRCLSSMADILRECRTALVDMKTGCSPDVFYFQLRPYLSGSQAIPGGVLYQAGANSEEGDGTGVKYSMPGATAAQSPIFQALDLILGITHTENSGRSQFVEKMRKSMPAYHAQFLEDLKSLPSISQFIAGSHSVELKTAYNDVVGALAAFRSEHVQIVTLYVLSPSKRSQKPNDKDDNAPKQGSGGSGDLFALLKGMRDDTKASALNL